MGAVTIPEPVATSHWVTPVPASRAKTVPASVPMYKVLPVSTGDQLTFPPGVTAHTVDPSAVFNAVIVEPVATYSSPLPSTALAVISALSELCQAYLVTPTNDTGRAVTEEAESLTVPTYTLVPSLTGSVMKLSKSWNM